MAKDIKFRKTGERAPRFKQIVAYKDTIVGLVGEAVGDTGTVWVYIAPQLDAGEVGWYKLSRDVVEREDTEL